jgi:hypothetical protein
VPSAAWHGSPPTKPSPAIPHHARVIE